MLIDGLYRGGVTGKVAAGWPAARWDELMLWNRAAQTVELVAEPV